MVSKINNIGNRGLLNSLSKTDRALGSSINKLSSGLRITKASDDAAGLSIAVNLESDSAAFKQAVNNISDGASLLKVAEGGLSQISSMLSRAKELAIQSANGTLDDSTRQIINEEFNSIIAEIDRTAQSSEFNGQKLTNGELAPDSENRVDIQVGAKNSANDRISLNVIESATASQLGIDSINVSTRQNALNSIESITNALDQITSARANVGATQNRLSKAASNIGVSIENLTSAATAIKGLDFAEESSKLEKGKVLRAANISAIGQSNDASGKLIGRLIDIKS